MPTMALRVLTWNLFHGRAVPSAGRALQREFTELIAGWAWDVALLQEVQPWWPQPLARACGAQQRTALTSRNQLPAVRRFLAERWPDLLKSEGGGCNAILARGDAIAEHREIVLRTKPERRVCHAVRLAGGLWCANVHAEGSPQELAHADTVAGAQAALGWAGDGPLIYGGDLNVKRPAVDGFELLASDRVDHVLGRGVGPARSVTTPEHGTLSDHEPLLVEVER